MGSLKDSIVPEFKNMKFRVKDEEHSKQIQEYLFSLGYKWSSGYNVKHQDKPFMFANSDCGLGWDDDLVYFEEHDYSFFTNLNGFFSFFEQRTKEFNKISKQEYNSILKSRKHKAVAFPIGYAKKILIDINDDNHIKFEVYDSNYGGNQQYIDVKRIKLYNNLDGNNKNSYQYKCSYRDKKVSLSVSIPNIDVNL